MNSFPQGTDAGKASAYWLLLGLLNAFSALAILIGSFWLTPEEAYIPPFFLALGAPFCVLTLAHFCVCKGLRAHLLAAAGGLLVWLSLYIYLECCVSFLGSNNNNNDIGIGIWINAVALFFAFFAKKTKERDYRR